MTLANAPSISSSGVDTNSRPSRAQRPSNANSDREDVQRRLRTSLFLDRYEIRTDRKRNMITKKSTSRLLSDSRNTVNEFVLGRILERRVEDDADKDSDEENRNDDDDGDGPKAKRRTTTIPSESA